MPYLRVTCPALTADQRRLIARRLTDEVEALFYHPRGGPSREELREHTTVQFVPYGEADLFIGGRTPDERGTPDVTVELSDWSMSVRQQRRVAARLTPVLASLFGVPQNRLDSVNLRFHPYPPRDFAVGGRLLSDQVPRVGQVLKKLLG